MYRRRGAYEVVRLQPAHNPSPVSGSNLVEQRTNRSVVLQHDDYGNAPHSCSLRALSLGCGFGFGLSR